MHTIVAALTLSLQIYASTSLVSRLDCMFTEALKIYQKEYKGLVSQAGGIKTRCIVQVDVNVYLLCNKKIWILHTHTMFLILTVQ